MDTIKFEVKLVTSIGIAPKKFEDAPINMHSCAESWREEMQAYITATGENFRVPVTIERIEIVYGWSK